MASTITKASIVRGICITPKIQRYSSSPQGVPVGGIPSYQVKTTVLPNKVVVASAEHEGLISRVSVVFRAGSRNETSDNVGTTHMLRIAAGLSTRNASQFAITRHIQQVGANLTCSTDREVIAYTLEGTRPTLGETLPFLTEVSTQQRIRPWELADNMQRVHIELAQRPYQLRAIDLLHKAAYRNRGLGNSLYIAKYNINKVSVETLQHYVSNNFTTNRTAVIGLGVDHKDLVNYAECLQLPTGGDIGQSEYKGGEIRSDKGGDMAHIAFAGKGASLKNTNEALSFAVLQKAMGTGSAIKYGQGNKGPFAQLTVDAEQPASVVALNVSYSDSGLFGALISAPSSDAGAILRDLVDALKSASLSEEDVNRGKTQLKVAILSALESDKNAIEDIGYQAVLLGCIRSASEIVAAIDDVSACDVNNALKQVVSSKFSIASVGNLRCVPFLEELP